jgi:adenylosuccinate synthase
MRAKIVIGMNYGDEGKGHIVDYLSDASTLVVRHNGGAQAGHAVVTPSGDEHIFHHFGSGALRGARTLLARRFILNPIIFMQELSELLPLVAMRETLIDPRCIVTTPYDMMINKYLSAMKGAHDTVGVGINETVERCQYDQIALNARDLKERSDAELLARLKQIENEWIPFRLEQLHIDKNTFKHWATKFLATDLEKKYIDYTKWMIERSMIWEDANVIERFVAKDSNRHIVFEGAQGMLLDQRRKKFHPYLTRSNTGVRNALRIIKDIKQPVDGEVIIVSRSYLTRHGDGPMLNDTEPVRGLGDATNPENEFQGKMRFGTLDANWYAEAVEEIRQECDYRVSVAMTCLDQTKGKVDFWNGDTVHVNDLKDVDLISTGCTHLDVREAVIAT